MKKQIFSHLLTTFGVLLLLCSACKKGDSFITTGVVSGADGQMLYLENVGVSVVEVLDSTRLSSAGKFKFTKQRPASPEFYRLRLNNQLINFAVDSTETVSFTADAGTFATTYTVEGSDNNISIKEITLAQLDANQTINELRRMHEGGQLSDTLYASEVKKVADSYKEKALKYIYAAPMSTTAYFALFQQIDGLLFFDLYNQQDLRAFGAVATSLDANYPESLRAQHLKNLTLQAMKVMRAQREVNLDDVNVQEVSYLEISLPDVTGKLVKLSDVAEGEVTILNFTSFMSEWSPGLNIELGEIYEKYKNRGLIIYQVSLDSDLHFWRNAAVNIPWVCVRDPQSVYSEAAAMYNVRQLPTLFVLDRQGNLVQRIENLEQLDGILSRLLR